VGADRVAACLARVPNRRGARFLGHVRMARGASDLPPTAPREGGAPIPSESRARVPAPNGSQPMTNTMSYRGYVASMTFDAEDKVIVGRVLDVEDVITFHGESVADFEANFHMVV